MTEFFYDDKEYKIILNKVNEKINEISFSEEAINIINKDLDYMENHEELDRLIRYLPYLTNKHNSIIDMVKSPKIVFLDYNRILQKNNIIIREIADWYENSSDYVKLDFDMIYDLNSIELNPSIYIDFLEYKYRKDFDKEMIFLDLRNS